MQSPRNLKSISLVAAALLGSVAQLASSPSLAFDINTDRPGSDYLNFDLPNADPALCAARCDRDSQCRAWTYVEPGAQGPLPRCWLKNSVPATVAADFAESGVRGFEYNIDRPGSDYNNFDLSSADPALCAARCNGENQCVAWTYVRPGIQGTSARCWLKNNVPTAVVANYGVSGVRVFEYNTDRPGGDYLNFDLTAADPALCAARCNGENQCRAWTYVKPGVQAASARCWLKNSAPVGVTADFAVSGVRTGLPPPATAASFAGNWNVPGWGEVTVTQAGNRVGGTFSASGGGTIDGTVTGNVWQGEYIRSSDGLRGTFRAELAADGRSFKGTGETTGFSGAFNGERVG